MPKTGNSSWEPRFTQTSSLRLANRKVFWRSVDEGGIRFNRVKSVTSGSVREADSAVEIASILP
jgi:hypothetical protein